MSPLKAGQLEIEKELRQAITKKELFLEYQPIVDINTNRITGAEALIRWKHKTLGSISPSVFIPYSEESGQIIQLGEWVFTESCSQLAEWRKAKLNVTLNINISARELLEENVIRKMQQLVKLANLPPKDIILEMTETFLIKDMKSFAKIVEQIKKLGFKTALDDFGTGYASLLYLKSLPVDYIKIDKSFIRGSITNEQDAAIIKAIISIAHNLGIKVIAEGVEKETENLFLKTYGCDMVQGNYYSRPISGEQFKLLTQKVPLTHART
jgi:EAL domain-containing protein (putative c-di-GMP-specific phosphodiesterase class I)